MSSVINEECKNVLFFLEVICFMRAVWSHFIVSQLFLTLQLRVLQLSSGPIQLVRTQWENYRVYPMCTTALMWSSMPLCSKCFAFWRVLRENSDDCGRQRILNCHAFHYLLPVNLCTKKIINAKTSVWMREGVKRHHPLWNNYWQLGTPEG